MEVEGVKLFEDLESGERGRLEAALLLLLRHFNEGKDVSKYWHKLLTEVLCRDGPGPAHPYIRRLSYRLVLASTLMEDHWDRMVDVFMRDALSDEMEVRVCALRALACPPEQHRRAWCTLLQTLAPAIRDSSRYDLVPLRVAIVDLMRTYVTFVTRNAGHQQNDVVSSQGILSSELQQSLTSLTETAVDILCDRTLDGNDSVSHAAFAAVRSAMVDLKGSLRGAVSTDSVRKVLLLEGLFVSRLLGKLRLRVERARELPPRLRHPAVWPLVRASVLHENYHHQQEDHMDPAHDLMEVSELVEDFVLSQLSCVESESLVYESSLAIAEATNGRSLAGAGRWVFTGVSSLLDVARRQSSRFLLNGILKNTASVIDLIPEQYRYAVAVHMLSVMCYCSQRERDVGSEYAADASDERVVRLYAMRKAFRIIYRRAMDDLLEASMAPTSAKKGAVSRWGAGNVGSALGGSTSNASTSSRNLTSTPSMRKIKSKGLRGDPLQGPSSGPSGLPSDSILPGQRSRVVDDLFADPSVRYLWEGSSGVFGDDAICSVCESAEEMVPIVGGTELRAWTIVAGQIAEMCVRVLRWTSAVSVQTVLKTCVLVARVQQSELHNVAESVDILETLLPLIVLSLQNQNTAQRHTRITALGVVAHYADLEDSSLGQLVGVEVLHLLRDELLFVLREGGNSFRVEILTDNVVRVAARCTEFIDEANAILQKLIADTEKTMSPLTKQVFVRALQRIASIAKRAEDAAWRSIVAGEPLSCDHPVFSFNPSISEEEYLLARVQSVQMGVEEQEATEGCAHLVRTMNRIVASSGRKSSVVGALADGKEVRRGGGSGGGLDSVQASHGRSLRPIVWHSVSAPSDPVSVEARYTCEPSRSEVTLHLVLRNCTPFEIRDLNLSVGITGAIEFFDILPQTSKYVTSLAPDAQCVFEWTYIVGGWADNTFHTVLTFHASNGGELATALAEDMDESFSDVLARDDADTITVRCQPLKMTINDLLRPLVSSTPADFLRVWTRLPASFTAEADMHIPMHSMEEDCPAEKVIDLLVDAIWNSPFETVIERVYMNGIGVQMSFASSTWFGEPVYMFMQGTQVPSTKAPPVKDGILKYASFTQRWEVRAPSWKVLAVFRDRFYDWFSHLTRHLMSDVRVLGNDSIFKLKEGVFSCTNSKSNRSRTSADQWSSSQAGEFKEKFTKQQFLSLWDDLRSVLRQNSEEGSFAGRLPVPQSGGGHTQYNANTSELSGDGGGILSDGGDGGRGNLFPRGSEASGMMTASTLGSISLSGASSTAPSSMGSARGTGTPQQPLSHQSADTKPVAAPSQSTLNTASAFDFEDLFGSVKPSQPPKKSTSSSSTTLEDLF